jgi:predicted AAA+ superfamily ATPase
MKEREVIQILMSEFADKLKRLNDLVKREERFPDAPNKIKVAIGMRRSGKTYFLYQQILKLLDEGIPLSRTLYINFEDDRLLPLSAKKLADLIEAFYAFFPENHDQRCFLFLDEIQNIPDWPTVIRRFHDSKNAEIYLTGSSAKLLSKEIATNLRGRSLATEIWPYSFQEFMKARDVKIDKKPFGKKSLDFLTNIFINYLSDGGFPEVNRYQNDERQQTLQEYVDVVIYRDIIERHIVKNPTFIKYMILSLIHNMSKPFAVNKFYNDTKSQGYKVGKDMLYKYADHIEDAFLAFFVTIYDPSIRKVQSNPKKTYCIDPGLVRAITFDYEKDFGKLFENVIYLELRRMGCKINYYLTRERYEVDFLAQSLQGQKKLFQVVWNIDENETLAREERALKAGVLELGIKGEIVTLDSYLREGIKF